MITIKRELTDVLADKMPGKRFSVTEDHHGKAVLNFDCNLTINEVEKLKKILKSLKVKIELERMVF